MTTDPQPIVSVIMTVYNREKYIADAIKSVIASTLKDWELLIVDDMSNDRSVEIARSYADTDDRIKIYINEKNLGDYPNRNQAAGYATGKYIKYLDSDDLIYPHGLEIMVGAMEKNPEAGIGFSDLNDRGSSPYPFLVNSFNCYKKHFYGKGFLYHGPTGCIYSAKAFNRINGFNTEFGVASDLEFNLRMTAEYQAVIFNRDLYWWRVHENQEINQKKNDYEFLTHLINKKHLHSDQCPLGDLAVKAYKNHLAVKTRKVLCSLLKLKIKRASKIHSSLKLKPRDYYWAFMPSKFRQ